MTRLHAWLELGLLVLRAAKLTMVTHVGLANTVQVLPRRRRPVNALQGTSAPTRPHPPTAASAILAISAQAALLIRSHALCFQATIVPVDPLLGPECRAPLADGVEATRHWPCPAIASLVRSVPRAPLSRLVCHVRKVSLVLGPTWTRCHAHARWDSTATLAVPMRLGLVSHVCKVSCRCRLCLAVSGIHVLSRCYNTRMHVADKYACHISAECPPGRFCRGGSHMRELCTCPPGIRVRAPPDNASCTHTLAYTASLPLQPAHLHREPLPRRLERNNGWRPPRRSGVRGRGVLCRGTCSAKAMYSSARVLLRTRVAFGSRCSLSRRTLVCGAHCSSGAMHSTSWILLPRPTR